MVRISIRGLFLSYLGLNWARKLKFSPQICFSEWLRLGKKFIWKIYFGNFSDFFFFFNFLKKNFWESLCQLCWRLYFVANRADKGSLEKYFLKNCYKKLFFDFSSKKIVLPILIIRTNVQKLFKNIIITCRVIKAQRALQNTRQCKCFTYPECQ